jgi:hypothetical protein
VFDLLDEGSGVLSAYFANAGEDVHAVGSLDPIILHRDSAGWQPPHRSRGAGPEGAAAD